MLRDPEEERLAPPVLSEEPPALSPEEEHERYGRYLLRALYPEEKSLLATGRWLPQLHGCLCCEEDVRWLDSRREA